MSCFGRIEPGAVEFGRVAMPTHVSTAFEVINDCGVSVFVEDVRIEPFPGLGRLSGAPINFRVVSRLSPPPPPPDIWLAVGESLRIEVDWDIPEIPVNSPELVGGALVVVVRQSDTSRRAVLRAPISAELARPGALSVTPLAIDFGIVRPGFSETRAVLITNVGFAAAPWSARMQDSITGFSVRDSIAVRRGSTLAPGESAVVRITFDSTRLTDGQEIEASLIVLGEMSSRVAQVRLLGRRGLLTEPAEPICELDEPSDVVLVADIGSSAQTSMRYANSGLLPLEFWGADLLRGGANLGPDAGPVVVPQVFPDPIELSPRDGRVVALIPHGVYPGTTTPQRVEQIQPGGSLFFPISFTPQERVDRTYILRSAIVCDATIRYVDKRIRVRTTAPKAVVDTPRNDLVDGRSTVGFNRPQDPNIKVFEVENVGDGVLNIVGLLRQQARVSLAGATPRRAYEFTVFELDGQAITPVSAVELRSPLGGIPPGGTVRIGISHIGPQPSGTEVDRGIFRLVTDDPTLTTDGSSQQLLPPRLPLDPGTFEWILIS